jgi:peroxiredoxin
MGPPQPGDQAPLFELPRTDGTTFRLADARGSWVLLHFTASWCPFCDAEVEHLGEIAEPYASRGVKVVLIDVQEEQAHWLEYAKSHVAPGVIALWDGSGDAARRFAPPRAQPSFEDRAQAVFDSTLIVDPQGRIRLFLLPDSKHFDPTFGAVKAELDRMLAEGGSR